MRRRRQSPPGEAADLRAAVEQLQEATNALTELRSSLARLEQQLKHDAASRALSAWDPDGLAAHEARVLSQNGEDGVLVEILRRLGRRRGRFVEIGASSTEANCLFLADALGYAGLFVDANAIEMDRLARKYRSRPDVAVACARVTVENVRDLLADHGVMPGFEVLSIDIDGNDYWVWRTLIDFRPAVVVIEHNAVLAADDPVVQRYDPAYVWDGTTRFGASRAAMLQLGEEGGYELVHTDLTGVNLFFVRRELWSAAPADDSRVVRPPNYGFRLALHPEGDRRDWMQRLDDPRRAANRNDV